jgi:hypothetical protein
MDEPKQFRGSENIASREREKPLPHTAPFNIPIDNYDPIPKPFIPLAQFLLSSPLSGTEIQCSRDDSPGREIVMKL